MDDEEFQRLCLDEGRLLPLPTLSERHRHAADFARLATIQLRAATYLLGTDAEEMLVGHAYHAMEAKVNELLAISGFRSKSHVCTQAALSRLLGRPDLARPLSLVYRDRQVFDYTADPGSMRAAKDYAALLRLASAYLESVDTVLWDYAARK